MTAENDPVDTIAATVLVPRTTDTGMIDRPAERRDHGAGPQSAGRGREEIVRQNEMNVLEEIGQPTEGNGLGETSLWSVLARLALEDIAVIETDTTAAAENSACTLFILAYLSCSNGAPYKQGFGLST